MGADDKKEQPAQTWPGRCPHGISRPVFHEEGLLELHSVGEVQGHKWVHLQ